MSDPSPTPQSPLILDIHTVFGPVPPRGVSEPGTARLLSQLGSHGVAGAITLSTRGLYHSAAAGNRETIALCQQAGGPLQPAAILDPRQPLAADSVTGARMICLMPTTQAWPVRFAPLMDALKALAAKGTRVPLFWEVTRMGDATAAREALEASGYDGPVVFGSVSLDALVEAVAVAVSGGDRYYVATNGMRGVGAVARAVETLGATRVVYGSGAPVRTMGGALGIVRVAGLSAHDLELVLGGNAKRLLASGGVAL